MKHLTIKTGAVVAALFTAGSALAGGPPGGVPVGPPQGIPVGPPPGAGGPPAGVPAGPPAGVPAGPPQGVPAGPPSGVPAGPPAVATSHIPQGAPLGKPDGLPDSAASIGSDVSGSAAADVQGDPSLAKAASMLEQLNAAHASDTGLAHASPNSIVGALAAYKQAVIDAAGDTTALTAAQDQLATSTHTTLTPDVITNLNTLLGV